MGKKGKRVLKIYKFLFKHKIFLFFIFLLAFHIFLRFYQLAERTNLGWDQIDTAWAVKKILVDHELILEGVPVKNNSGIYMGPLYYYISSIFYLFTRLDPIASALIAGATSIFSFFVLFFVTKKIFNVNVALVAVFINTFAVFIISNDRVQNGIGLVVPISFLIFYFLYKVITKSEKNLPLLAVVLGFSFHVDFTSVLYPLILLFALPLFPRSRKTLYYSLISILIFIAFIFPTLITEFTGDKTQSKNFSILFQTYFHGFHLRRFLQLTHDAFSGFLVVFNFNKIVDYFGFLLLSLFGIIYYFSNPKKEKLVFLYLTGLWIIVPWIVLSTYSGELTNSYFSLPQNIVIVSLAYLTYFIYKRKNIVIKIIPIIFWGIFAIYGIQEFYKPHPGNYLGVKGSVSETISQNKTIPFKDKDPHSYMYFYLKENR